MTVNFDMKNDTITYDMQVQSNNRFSVVMIESKQSKSIRTAIYDKDSEILTAELGSFPIVEYENIRKARNAAIKYVLYAAKKVKFPKETTYRSGAYYAG